jgi:hypothetical protein
MYRRKKNRESNLDLGSKETFKKLIQLIAPSLTSRMRIVLRIINYPYVDSARIKVPHIFSCGNLPCV